MTLETRAKLQGLHNELELMYAEIPAPAKMPPSPYTWLHELVGLVRDMAEILASDQEEKP